MSASPRNGLALLASDDNASFVRRLNSFLRGAARSEAAQPRSAVLHDAHSEWRHALVRSDALATGGSNRNGCIGWIVCAGATAVFFCCAVLVNRCSSFALFGRFCDCGVCCGSWPTSPRGATLQSPVLRKRVPDCLTLLLCIHAYYCSSSEVQRAFRAAARAGASPDDDDALVSCGSCCCSSTFTIRLM